VSGTTPRCGPFFLLFSCFFGCRCGRAGASAGVGVQVWVQCAGVWAQARVCGCGPGHGCAGAVWACGCSVRALACQHSVRVWAWVQLRVWGWARRKLDLYIDPGNIVLMSRQFRRQYTLESEQSEAVWQVGGGYCELLIHCATENQLILTWTT